MPADQVAFRLAVWALFFNGVGLHILLRARGSIASRSNSVKTFRAWWELNWHDLGWRLFLDGLGLMAWEVAPFVPGMKDFVSHILPPICYGAAPVMGVVVDRFIDSGGFILGFSRVDNGEARPAPIK